MKEIAIFGAGGLGREIACLIHRINRETGDKWLIKGFYDDGIEKGTKVSHFGEVLGGVEDLNLITTPLAVVIAIGNPKIVRLIVERITNARIEFPNIICPNTYFSDPSTFLIGKGNIIQSDCKFSCDVTVGDFNVFNGSIVLGHDAKMGSFNTIMPAVRISGEVVIGDNNFFGIGSIVLQQLKIGSNVRLGAGSVLMKKPKDDCLYIGVPAKRIEI